MALTAKQQRFVAEYLVDLNATQAAIRAGFSEKTARSKGSHLLKDPIVQGAVAEAMAARQVRTEITQDRILLELARIAFFDPRKLFNADGSPKPINELDDDTAAVLAGMDITEIYEGTGEDRKFTGYLKKVKWWDKGQALTLAMRHKSMLTDKTELTGPNGGPIEVAAKVNFYLPDNGR